jgi:hypothetical protein
VSPAVDLLCRRTRLAILCARAELTIAAITGISISETLAPGRKQAAENGAVAFFFRLIRWVDSLRVTRSHPPCRSSSEAKKWRHKGEKGRD